MLLVPYFQFSFIFLSVVPQLGWWCSARSLVPVTGLWCSLHACGVLARPPVVPLGPDRTVVPLANLRCPQQARGAPDRPKVPLRGRWCRGVPGRPMVPLLGWCCSWQTCGAPDKQFCGVPDKPVVPLMGGWCPGPQGGGATHVTPSPGSATATFSVCVCVCVCLSVFYNSDKTWKSYQDIEQHRMQGWHLLVWIIWFSLHSGSSQRKVALHKRLLCGPPEEDASQWCSCIRGEWEAPAGAVWTPAQLSGSLYPAWLVSLAHFGHVL